MQLVYCIFSFNSTVTHHRGVVGCSSRVTGVGVEFPQRDISPGLPKSASFAKFRVEIVEICGSVTPILPAVEMSNWFKVSRVTPLSN